MYVPVFCAVYFAQQKTLDAKCGTLLAGNLAKSESKMGKSAV